MQHIFIHGLGQTSSSWDNTISFLTKPIHLCCLNLPALLDGKAITYANLYAGFSKYCNAISEPLCLCGLSLGGVLALNYTVDNPEKVQSLILIGTQYKIPKAFMKFQNIIFRIMPKSAFRSMGLGKSDVIGLTNSMVHLDFSAELKNISCNTLIICGEKDNANKKAAKELSERINGARLYFIDNASHEVNKDNPKKLASEIEAHCHY